MLLPYNKARCHMFKQLQPFFPQPPTSHVHGPIIDEAALAKRVTDMVALSMSEMIQKAVLSAFNAVNPTAPPQQGSTRDTEPCLPPLAGTHTSPHQSLRKSELVKINVSDETEENQPPLITVNPHTPHIEYASASPIHTQTPPCTSQKLGPIIPNVEMVHHSDIMSQALQRIRVLIGKPTATWTCNAQKEAMRAVLDLTNDVLALMCTGSGKTMLAIIPTLLEKQSITVAVLPLKSLTADYIRKLDDMDVLYEIFSSKSTRISGTKNLVLVSVDRARSPQWRQALAEVNHRVKVVRMVVDEGQLALTADEYRDALKDLYELRQFKMQLVVLSGTLQPISEEALMDTFGMAKSTIIIRTRTIRPELQYILEKPRSSNKDISRRVLDIIHHHKTQMSASDRVLVFVPYMDEGQILASLLECKFYNGGKDVTDEERQSAYDSWIKGTDQIMICTAAFGAGNDYPHVRLVIHAGTPQEMIGCIQEKSRAGRDGKPAKCYFLPRLPGVEPVVPSGVIDHKGKVAMYKWLFSKKKICLRYGMTIFCDGVGTYCHNDSSYQKCSICEPSLLNSTINTSSTNHSTKRPAEDRLDEAYRISKQRKINKETQSLDYVDRMKRSLDFFKDICAYCKVHGKDVPKHNILDCPQLAADQYKDRSSYIRWRDDIQYHKERHNRICYFCHVPQCHDRLHPTFVKGSPRVCTYPDIVAPVVYGICHKPAILSCAREYFYQEWNNMTEFMTWVNSIPINGEKSNLTALFSWYYTTYCTIR